MSDFADEMDAAGQDHDLTTGDPAPEYDRDGDPIGVIGTDGNRYEMTAIEYFMRVEHPEVFDRPLSDFAQPIQAD